MNTTAPRVERIDVGGPRQDIRLSFHCPGCGCGHAFRIAGQQPVWTWNGSMERPTFSPSLLYQGGPGDLQCHSYVREGRIEFLSDCKHALAGKTVEMEPIT